MLTCEAALGSQLTEARQQFGTTVTAEVFLSFHKEVTSKKPKASQMTLSARLANLKVTSLVERELASTETSQYSSADFESKAEKTEQRLERQSKGHVLSQDEIREGACCVQKELESSIRQAQMTTAALGQQFKRGRNYDLVHGKEKAKIRRKIEASRKQEEMLQKRAWALVSLFPHLAAEAGSVSGVPASLKVDIVRSAQGTERNSNC